MVLVAREKKNGETGLYAIEYVDCDFNEINVNKTILFEDYETAEQYGKEHYDFEKTGRTEFYRIITEDGKEAVRPPKMLDKWDVDHPLCSDYCPCSMHPEFCPDFATCPRFEH